MSQKIKTLLSARLGFSFAVVLSATWTSAFAKFTPDIDAPLIGTLPKILGPDLSGAPSGSGSTGSSVPTGSSGVPEVCTVTLSGETIFTGLQIKPEVKKVVCGENVYTQNEISTSYGKNTDAGEGSVTITLPNDNELTEKFTIVKRPITVNVDNAEMELYGVQPNYTYKISGTDGVNSDTLSNFINKLSGYGCEDENNEYQCVLNSNALLHLEVNESSITKVGDVLAIANTSNYDLAGEFPNYNIEVTPGTLTITKNKITVAAGNKTKFFGEADPDLTPSITGNILKDDYGKLPKISVTRTEGENVGSYGLSVNLNGDAVVYDEMDDYTITPVPGTLTIEPADISELDIIYDDKQAYTGEPICPAITIRNGGNVLALSSSDDYSVTCSDNVNVGTASMTIMCKENSNCTGVVDTIFTINEPVKYVDADGSEKTVTKYTVLTSNIAAPNEKGNIMLQDEWYVVKNSNPDGVDVSFQNTLVFDDDVHIILMDGAEMDVNVLSDEDSAIVAKFSLTIYGQSGQSGILVASGKNVGIFSGRDVSIIGGRVTVFGEYGVYSDEGNITLSWTNSTDSIKVSNLYLGVDTNSVSIADGKFFKDADDIVYSGELTREQIAAVAGKTLVPAMEFPKNTHIADISDTTYIGDYICPNPVVKIGENELVLGKDYKFECSGNLNASDTASVVVEGIGNYLGKITKMFKIKKAPLVVTALNDTIVYGDKPSNEGVEYSGFVGKENEEILRGNLNITYGGYKQYGDAGEYAITPSGLTAENYEVKFVAGKLTVNQKRVSIAWNDEVSFAYNGEEHAPTPTIDGFVDGFAVKWSLTGAAVNVGNHTAKVVFDETDANFDNYKLPQKGLEQDFNIFKLLTHPDITVTATLSQSGNGYNAAIVVADGEKELIEGTDYDVETNGNSAAGIVKTITGKGDYSGSLVKYLVPYIDEKGKLQVAYDPTVLTSDIKPGISGNIELSGGWYVVQGHVSFENTVIFLGDVHLILADDAVMNVATSEMWGVRVLENFTVYGQAAGSGKLEAHSEYMAICTIEDFAVIGGNIEATGDNSYDISGKNITISGGFVTAKGKYGILGSENITISGGIVTANGDGGITANGALTLGWTLETNRITAGSYDAEQGIIIAKGKKFQDGTGKIYFGAIDREQAKALAGQTLTPFTGLIVTFDSDIHTETTNISLAHQIIVVDENGHVAAPEDPTYDGYKFLGWYTSADGDTKFDFEAPITTDMTAYAKWEVAKYTITVVGEYLTVDKTEAIEGETVTLTVDYDGDYIIMIGANGMEFNLDDYAQLFNVQKSGNSISFDMRAVDITLRLAEKVGVEIAENIPYIDENGKTNICEKAEVIQSDYVISRGGWYVVEGDVTANLIMIYSVLESIHIILKDNAKLTLAGVEDEGEVMSALILGNLSIYAQSIGDNVGSFIAEGVFVAKNLIVNGGSIQAKAVGAKELQPLITMNGGSVNANDADIEQLTMNGGSLKVLDYTNSFDIAAGTYIADEDGIVYSGTLSKEQIATIGGKTLTPIVPKSLSDKSIVVADILAQNYDNGNPVCPSVVVTDGKDTLKAGTDYSVECFNNTGITSASLDEAAYVKISGMNRYKDDIEKRFFIWNNIGDYAAVQVFEDADGKTHAEINGEYDGTETVSIPTTIVVDSIDYVRTFDKGIPATAMLPFRLPDCATVNAKFYKLTNAEVVENSWNVTMTNIQKLGEKLPQANTSYAVILPENGRLKFNFESCGADEKAELQTDDIVSSSNAEGTWFFTGTYSYKEWLSDNENKGEIGLVYAFSGSNNGGVAKGKFGRIAAGSHANPMRSYLRKRDQYVTVNNPLGIPPSNPSTPNGASLVARYSINMLPETVNVNFVDDVNYADIESGNRSETTTAVGRAVPAADKIRVIRNRGTYDLKGRRVNEGRKAKGAYYKR